jgi:hypothetical protein
MLGLGLMIGLVLWWVWFCGELWLAMVDGGFGSVVGFGFDVGFGLWWFQWR